MPTFPSYHGPPLPEALDPKNPRHYLMLADWVFFKPSRLKQYLYRTDPELYFQSGVRALARALRLPACRNLSLMTPLLALALSLAIAVVVSWLASAVQRTPLDWLDMVRGVALGVAGGVALGVALGVAGDVALGVTSGVALGVALGVAFGVAGGVAGGMAFGVAGGIVWGMMFGAAGGVVWGVALGLAWGMEGGVTGGVAGVIGALRGIFYLFQVGPALWLARRPGPALQRLARHPALGDELAVLPFPGLGRLLARALAEDPALALRATRTLLRNPFQRWAVARGWSRFLSQTPDPLAALYEALPDPLLAEYPVEPITEERARLWPFVGALWLGEVAGVFVDATGGQRRTSERLAWAATRRLRGQPHPGRPPGPPVAGPAG